MVLSPTSTVLVETEDKLETVVKQKTNEPPKTTIRDEEFVEFQVLGRCRYLFEGIETPNS